VPLNFQRELEPARLTAQSNKLAKDRANIAVGLAAVHADQLVPPVIYAAELPAIIGEVTGGLNRIDSRLVDSRSKRRIHQSYLMIINKKLSNFVYYEQSAGIHRISS